MSQLTPNGNPRLFTRAEVKASVMQAGYSQQEKGTRQQLSDDLGSKYDESIYPAFIQAIEETVPGFFTVMDWVNNLWSKDWEEISFLMPDGHRVVIKPTSSEWVKFRPFDQFEVDGRIGGVDKEDNTLLLWVTIIHAVDAYIARRMIIRANKRKKKKITIHDDFVQLANDAVATKQDYREELADINDNPLLEYIIEQITGKRPETIIGDLDSKDILNSTYAIC